MSPESHLTPTKKAERAAREARLAEALRANLKRRKEQGRARAVPTDAASAGLSGAPVSSKSKPDGENTAD